ncbi:Terpenoid synthase 28 [Raphanus sativus]|uniref:Terpenoid synthase 28-like n=1 Tax=Raphanus sativus TaxID=3726 RepID=A0A9W3CE67_RAPSA|nr:terpenoid synthase 28-like [Raphanus sativus]KAJ4878154.1 Terpenoid synthase 28 [Raphanus sativus]
MDGVPDYLKSLVKFIFGTFQEFEREVGSELGGRYSVEATIEYFKEYIRSNLQLAKWACADHLPSFEEYLYVGGLEVAVDLTVACILMAMENICKEEAFEWLKSRDKLLRATSTKARVPNDMFGYKDDMSRGYLTGSVNCYKKQYGVTEEEAFIKLRQLIAELDKMMNEDILKPINVPREVLKVVIDTLRALNVGYDKDDGFTHHETHLKNHITSIYVDI